MPDTTLSSLFPGVPTRILGERVEVRPIVFRDLRTVERVMDGWVQLVASGGESVDQEAWEDFQDLLASGCGKDRSWLARLPEDDFERLTSLALAVNRNIWDPPKNEQAGDSFTWAQIVQRLVEHGHPWESMQLLTLSQIRAFLEETFRSERESFARDITAASFSMVDGKTVQKVTKELRRG